MGQMKSLFADFLEKYEECTLEEIQEELDLYNSLQSRGVTDELRISFLEQLLSDKEVA